MVAFDALLSRDTDLIRKSLDAAVFLAPLATALPATLTSGASGDLVALAADWIDVGWMDKGDGITEGRKVTSQETESLGSTAPTRRDISKVDSTIVFTAQETKLITMQLAFGVILDPADFDATSKEVIFDEATRPDTVYYRCLVIWKDNAGTDSIYGATLYPRTSVTDMDDIKNTDAGDPRQFKITMSAYVDAGAGTHARHLHGGPGWITRLEAMGWTAA
jgi:hypothetical protein